MPKQTDLKVIGWREWVSLPELGIRRIKAKVDSGARSSSLHAFDIERIIKDEEDWVRFKVHPVQKRTASVLHIEARMHDTRQVRSSSGESVIRPVIETNITMLGLTWPIELTLANRDQMGFRMLLGRQAFRNRFLLDAGKSYFGGKPKRRKT